MNKLRIGPQLICTGNVYELRTGFQQRLKLMEKERQAEAIDAITSLDTKKMILKTYDGGCAFLLDWFQRININSRIIYILPIIFFNKINLYLLNIILLFYLSFAYSILSLQ